MEDRVTRRIFQANRSRDAAWKQRHRWERRDRWEVFGFSKSKAPKRMVNFGWNWNYSYFLELMGDVTKFYLLGGSIMFYMSSIYKWPTSRQPHWVGVSSTVVSHGNDLQMVGVPHQMFVFWRISNDGRVISQISSFHQTSKCSIISC